MTGWAAKLTSTAIGLPSRSSKRTTASIGSVAFGSRLVCRLRFSLTDSTATPIRAGRRALSASRIDRDEPGRQLLRILHRGVEFPLAQAGLVDQLDDGSMVRVAAGDEDVADAGLVGESPCG